MTDKDDNPDLTRAISSMTEGHLRCRDMGHRWTLKTAVSRLVPTLGEPHVPIVERKVQCSTCKTTRTEQFRRSNGEMLRRLYAYPEGYQFAPGVAGQGGMAKAPFRREWLNRNVPEED